MILKWNILLGYAPILLGYASISSTFRRLGYILLCCLCFCVVELPRSSQQHGVEFKEL